MADDENIESHGDGVGFNPCVQLVTFDVFIDWNWNKTLQNSTVISFKLDIPFLLISLSHTFPDNSTFSRLVDPQ